MARRKRKKKSASSNPLPMIIGASVAILILAGGYWILTSGGGPANSPTLPAARFQDDPGSLRGSDFSVAGKVKEKIYHSESNGSLISIEVIDNDKVFMFPVIVPSDIEGPNLSVEQSYIFNGSINSKERFIVTSYDDK